ncbi:MAG TPA: GIY-YIG nuclease family protein [Aquabacterium sp.]|nr:GIY-YIG nuclease family protein [Aquabacterium sp.]
MDRAATRAIQRAFAKVVSDRDAGESLFDAIFEQAGTVYFLQAGAFIKIGFTRWSVERRIAQLSTGCPYQIYLLLEVVGSSSLEAEYHRRLAKHRARGEWFHASTEVLEFILSLARPAAESAT